MAVAVNLVAYRADAVAFQYSTVTLTGNFPVGQAVFWAATDERILRDITFDGQPITPLRTFSDDSRKMVLCLVDIVTAGSHSFASSYDYAETVALACWSVTGAKKTPGTAYLDRQPPYPNEDNPVVTRPLAFAASGAGIAALFIPRGGGNNTTWSSPGVETFDASFSNVGSASMSSATYGSPTTPLIYGQQYAGPGYMGIAFDPEVQGATAAAAATLAAVAAASGAANAIRATAGRALGTMVSQAAGAALVAATGAVALQPVGGVASARVGVSAAAAATLGDLAGAATASRTATLSASALTTLQPIASGSMARVDVVGAGLAQLGPVTGSGAAAAEIHAASASALGGIDVVATGGPIVSATAAAQLAPVANVASAGAQPSLAAVSTAVLAPISTSSTARMPITASAVVNLDAISSSSGAAAPVRATAATALGSVTSLAASRIELSATSTAQLAQFGSVSAGYVVTRAAASALLGPVGSSASALAGDGEPSAGIAGPCWTAVVRPRLFSAAVTPRWFTAVSTGCKRMITFPGKYAHEVRHAAVDFAPALAPGESLIGVPTVRVSRGTLTTGGVRVDGSTVRLTLSGGSTTPQPVQRIEIGCQTSAGQTVEEIVLVTMLSAP